MYVAYLGGDVIPLFSSAEADSVNREANERFAAGYIQCMHEVHTFVSTCPGIDSKLTSELLNHLLECMPLNEEHLQEMILDLISEPSSSSGECVSSAPSPSPSSEDLCSDLEETESESEASSANSSSITHPEFMWRPW